MHTDFATSPPEFGPIDLDWTIADLMTWLSDDSRQHDVTLQEPLARIEAAATGSRWSRTPSTVALIRSLAAAVRDDPGLLRIRVCDLGARPTPQTSRGSRRIPQLA